MTFFFAPLIPTMTRIGETMLRNGIMVNTAPAFNVPWPYLPPTLQRPRIAPPMRPMIVSSHPRPDNAREPIAGPVEKAGEDAEVPANEAMKGTIIERKENKPTSKITSPIKKTSVSLDGRESSRAPAFERPLKPVQRSVVDVMPSNKMAGTKSSMSWKSEVMA